MEFYNFFMKQRGKYRPRVNIYLRTGRVDYAVDKSVKIGQKGEKRMCSLPKIANIGSFW